jgi:signal transduction histidine kinase
MGITGPMNQVATGQPPGGRPGGAPAVLLRRAVSAPFTARGLGELLFCLAGAALGVTELAAPFALAGLLIWILRLARGGRPPAHASSVHASSVHPAGVLPYFGLLLAVLAVLVIIAPRAGRRIGAVHRGLALRLLRQVIGDPAPAGRGRGLAGRLGAMLRDGPGWRAVAYPVARIPVTVAEIYASFFAAVGLADMTYPFWWPMFRNHPPGTVLQPVPVLTPFGAFGVVTIGGTFAAFAVGFAMVLAAPWVARGAVAADCWLMRRMLGPGRLAQRVADLERTRTTAVEDSAATLRRLERDLHDGAQVRLATLAMSLGMAREKLAADADPEVRELLDSAHQGAKDALADLRSLARGIHPPALDNGLADALATLAANSPTPVDLTVAVPERPAPAIESMAYFCAAELLANAAKHSGASRISIGLAGQRHALVLMVSDDGVGGADPARGSGLSGLAQRAATVDGAVQIDSPAGGPTRVTVTLPMHA